MSGHAADGDRGFDEVTYERASRLHRLLRALHEDERTSERLALHGGAAINEFILDVPRLSTDVDLSMLSESEGMDVVGREKERTLELVREVASASGFKPSYGKAGVAGRTVRLTYEGGAVKADVNFMNRVTPFEPVEMTSRLDGTVSFPVLAPYDAFGGKLRAALARTKARDLFDLRSIAEVAKGLDPGLFHGSMLLSASLSEPFPHAFRESFSDGLEGRFKNLQEDIDVNLAPMLREGVDMPSAGELIESAKGFIIEWVDPRNDEERSYLANMARGTFLPELILPDDVAERARRFPEALWKVRNLRRYVELPPEEGVTHPLWERRVNVEGTGVDEIGVEGRSEAPREHRDTSGIGNGREPGNGCDRRTRLP